MADQKRGRENTRREGEPLKEKMSAAQRERRAGISSGFSPTTEPSLCSEHVTEAEVEYAAD